MKEIKVNEKYVSLFIYAFMTFYPIIVFFIPTLAFINITVVIIVSLLAVIIMRLLKIRTIFIARFVILSFLLIVWCMAYYKILSDECLVLSLKTERITSIKGVAISDSKQVKNNMMTLTVRLDEIKDDNNDIRATSSGRVNVITTAQTPIYEGDTIVGSVLKIEDNVFNLRTIHKIRADDRFNIVGFLKDLRTSIISDCLDHITTLSRFSHSSVSWRARQLAILLIFSKTTDEGLLLKEKSRLIGLSHIFALSGMHLNLISSFLLYFASFFIPKNYRKKFVLPFLLIYTCIVGTSPSLVRSFFMIALITLFPSLKDYSLFLSLVLQTFLVKSSVSNVSFTLSYTSTVALVFLAKVVRFSLSSVLSCSKSEYLSTGISVLLLTSPFAIINFSSSSLYGVVLSGIAGVLVSINMVGGFIALILPGSIVASVLMEGSYYILEIIVNFFSKYPLSYSWCGYCILIAIITVLFLLKVYKLRRIKNSFYL